MNSYEEHRARSPKVLSFHLVTVSSGRFAKMRGGLDYVDESGDLAERMIREHSHKVVLRTLISDDRAMIRAAVRRFLRTSSDVLVFAGGTGVSPTDVTVETVAPFFEKELPGFGELLRTISYEKIGSPALLTRASAGISRGKFIVCLPGSPDAVATALSSFLGEFPHIVAISRGS